MVKSDEDLPTDIIIDVLSRLPVKSLIRFRCICKSWYDLFKSPNFISKHLKNDNDTHLFVAYMFVDETDEFSYPFELYCLFPDETLADLSSQDFHPQDPLYGIVGGPYDGIFCISRIDNQLTLWNRATKEMRDLPKFRAIPHYTSKSLTYKCGFGLDTMSNDYKFVMILKLWDEKTKFLYEFSHVAVYNLRTNTWKDSEHFKSNHNFMNDSSDGTYLDGVCYWLFSFQNNVGHKVIYSFHMGDEVVEEIQVPCFYESEYGTLGLYDYSLSLLLFDKHVNGFDMWMMKKRCWTKILTVGPLLGVKKPLGFWKKSSFFIHSNTDELLLYDPITQETRNLRLRSSWFLVYTYKESLITIKGDDGFFGFFEIPWHILGVY